MKILLLFSLIIGSLSCQAQDYIKTKARAGDGIFVLLGRYNLERSDCNYNKFCKINGLKRNAYLIVGKTYKLPLLKYKFNGKSIRSSASIDTWQQAKQVERYNDKMQVLGVKVGDFRRGVRELWVPYNLKYCPNDLEKFIPQNRDFSIFGKDYAKVPLKDKKLAGAVYYIVAGHGGPDPGAMGKYKGKTICEDEYAYDIALRLARNLIAHGAIAYVIIRDPNDGIRNEIYLPCDMDERCWGDEIIPVGQKARLFQRSDIINKLYIQNRQRGIEYQRVIAIHVDSRVKSKRIDLFFYHHPGSQIGRMMATRLHRTMESKYQIHRKSGEYHGTVNGRDLHMLREIKPTGIFIEVANIQNQHDQKRILLASNRRALADWMTEGLLKDY